MCIEYERRLEARDVALGLDDGDVLGDAEFRRRFNHLFGIRFVGFVC